MFRLADHAMSVHGHLGYSKDIFMSIADRFLRPNLGLHFIWHPINYITSWKFEHGRNGKVERFQGLNLYLKNLDDSIDDEKLKKLFEEFGEIASCKVMVDAQGRSKGSGFVSFTTAEAGHNAINGMNGKLVGKKPLYVALAQRKEERKEMLVAHFSHLNLDMAPIPYAAPQQVYWGQPAPGVIPPVFGFQQHFVPGMRPGSPIMLPNSMHRSRLGQRTGFRHGGMSGDMHQQQQMLHPSASHSVRYMPNARNGAYPAMAPLQQDGNHVAQKDAVCVPAIPSNNLFPTALASADPEQQQLILGNRLYLLVERLEREQAGKVTGMLLEMDKMEVLHLIESPEALRDSSRSHGSTAIIQSRRLRLRRRCASRAI